MGIEGCFPSKAAEPTPPAAAVGDVELETPPATTAAPAVTAPPVEAPVAAAAAAAAAPAPKPAATPAAPEPAKAKKEKKKPEPKPAKAEKAKADPKPAKAKADPKPAKAKKETKKADPKPAPKAKAAPAAKMALADDKLPMSPLYQLDISDQVLQVDESVLPAASVSPRERVRGEMVTIRLFISSTFVDTHGERDTLIKKVLPALNKELSARDVQIVPVDLRWGVAAHESTATTIQKTCLNEIDHCRVSEDEMPWFLGLRSSRYGWVQEKFNAPDDFEKPDRFGWMKGVQKAHPDGISITSMEVWHAVLGAEAARMEQPHAFFAFRDPGFQSDVPEDWQWVFDFEHKPEAEVVPEVSKMQYNRTPKAPQYRADFDTLTKQIRAATDKCACFDYAPSGEVLTKETGRLDTGKRFGTGTVQGLEVFADKVFSMLYTAIDREYPAYDQKIDEIVLSDVQHELRTRSLLPGFVGRKAELKTLRAYVDGANADAVPLVVQGPPGVGKSAILAQLIAGYNDSKDVQVIKHLVGSNSDSFSIFETLRRLCFNLKRYAVGGFSKPVPDQFKLIKSQWVLLLGFMNQKRSASERILIVIDGLSAMEAQAMDVEWVPAVLGAHVRLILGVSSDPAAPHEAVAALRKHQPAPTELAVEPLVPADSKALVRAYLNQFHKALSEDAGSFLGDQLAILMSKGESNTPLYLLAACAELISFGVYEKVTPYLKALPDSLSELFDFVLSRVEEEHGEEFVRVTFSLVALAHGGILEAELGPILESYRWTAERVSSFSRLYSSIRLFITAGGAGLLRIFYEPLAKVVETRYLSDPSVRTGLHDVLQSHYRYLADPRLDLTWAGGDARGFVQLPFHLNAARGPALAELLVTDPKFLRGKLGLSSLRVMRADFELEGASEATKLVRAILLKAGSAIEAESLQLPMSLMQGLTWCRDVPGVARILERARDICVEVIPRNAGGMPKPDADSAGAGGADAGAAVSAGDGTKPPKAGLITSYKPKGCLFGAVSPDGKRAVAGNVGHLFEIIDLESSETETEVSIMAWYANCTTFTPNSLRLVLSSGGILVQGGPSDLRLYDVASGQLIKQKEKAHNAPIGEHTISPSGSEVATCAHDKTCIVWDLDTLTEKVTFTGHNGKVATICFIDDGRIASGSFDNDLIVWDAATGKELTKQADVFDCYGAEMEHANKIFLRSSPDGTTLLAQTPKGKLHVYTLDGNSLVKRHTHDGSYAQHFAVLSDNKHAVFGHGEIELYNYRTNVLVRKISDASSPSFLSVTHNMCLLYGGFSSQSVNLWGVDVNAAAPTAEAKEKKAEAKGDTLGGTANVILVSNDGKRVIANARTHDNMAEFALTADGADFSKQVFKGNIYEAGVYPGIGCLHEPTGQIVVGDTYGKLVGFKDTPFSPSGNVEHADKEADNDVRAIINLCAVGEHIVSQSAKVTRVWAWPLASKTCIKKLEATGKFNSLCAVGDTKFMTGTDSHEFKTFTAKTGNVVSTKKCKDFKYEAKYICYFKSPSGAEGFGLTVGSKIHACKLDMSAMVISEKESNYNYPQAAVMYQDRYFVTDHTGSVTIWRMPDVHPLFTFALYEKIDCMAVSAAGVFVASLGEHGKIAVLDLGNHGETTAAWVNKANEYVDDSGAGKSDVKTIASVDSAGTKAQDLRTAAFKGEVDTVKKLIAEGVDVNSADLEYKQTAIMSVKTPEMLKILIDAGADVNHTNFMGMAAVHQGSMNPEMIKMLAKAGADLNVITNYNQCPVTAQVGTKNFKNAIALLELGADGSHADPNSKMNALDFCHTMDMNATEDEKKEIAQVEALLKKAGVVRGTSW